jgi:hypothetical protein
MELLKAMREMMAEAEAERKADQAKAEANMERQIGSLASNMNTDKEEMKADQKMMEENQAKAEANLVDMKESLKETMRVAVSVIEGKMEVIVHSTRFEWDKKIQRRNENVTERQEIPKEGVAVARLECEEQGPKEMEPGAERQLVPAEEVAVKSSRTKKRPRGRRIAVGRRIKPTKLIRGDGESRRKLVAACRKVSRCATVAWRRRNIFRDIRTQGNFGPRQELGAAGVMVTLRAKLAR